MTGPGDPAGLQHRLARRRALARLAILFELVWPAVWPALGLAGAFLCLALLDLPRSLPPLLHLALLGAVALGVLGLLARGLRRIAAPDDAAADRRLERASGLAHRPLAALADRPSGGAGGSLWTEHRARAAAQVARLRVGLPRPGLAARDRHALRGALVVALVAALVVAGPDAPARLADAFRPDLGHAAAAPAAQLQAWVTPPAYTGLPPSFLKAQGGTIEVPAGAVLTVSVTGGAAGPPSLVADGRAEPFHALDAASFQAQRTLTAGGRVAVRRGGRDLAAWEFTAVADRPPSAAFSEPPGRAARSLQLRLPWQTEDDYGVVALQAELRLRARPDAPPLTVAIGLPAAARNAHGVLLQDLTAHPWAGLEVSARLVARDAAGQLGASAELPVVLPERDFRHPVARAVIAVRKQLSLHPEDRRAAMLALDQIAAAPEAFDGDAGILLALRATEFLLMRQTTAPAIDEAQARLWELALRLEEGESERTAKAVEAAREAVRQALDQQARDPDSIDKAEIDRRLEALQQAIDRHIEALLDQARRDPNAEVDPDTARIDGRELDRMMEQAREAARQGRMDEARQKLAELERMLDKLREARAGGGQQDPKNAERRQRGRQQMGALQDMVQREGGVLDGAERRAAPAPAPTQIGPRPGAGAPRPAASDRAGDAGQRETDRRVQQALRRALGELMQQFGDLTGDVPASLGEADQAMRDAAGALAQGRDADARGAAQRAIEALQQGGRDMSRTMAQQFGPGQAGEGGEEGEDAGAGQDGQGPGTGPGMGMSRGPGRGQGRGDGRGPNYGDTRSGGRRDPLGRRTGEGGTGADQSADSMVPEEMERQRTRAIQDELRRRGAERERPQQELDYIDRLLKQF